jgi:DNA-binding NarL/FixJ family response regulator
MSEESLDLGGESVSVVIVDDHDAIRFGFRAQCSDFNFELLAEGATVDDALEKLGDRECQVAVLDLSLGDGSKVADNVSKFVARGIQVLIYSIGDKRIHINAALKAGAASIVTKSQSMNDLARAVRLVSHGVYINNTQTAAAIDADLEFKRDAKLSPKESEVLSLYASGLAQKQVAYQLGIADSTVKEHIDRVRQKYAKVGRPVTSKTELLRRAIEDGIIEDIA